MKKFGIKFSIARIAAAALSAIMAMTIFTFSAVAAQPTPANIRMDFIIGGKHAPIRLAQRNCLHLRDRRAGRVENCARGVE